MGSTVFESYGSRLSKKNITLISWCAQGINYVAVPGAISSLHGRVPIGGKNITYYNNSGYEILKTCFRWVWEILKSLPYPSEFTSSLRKTKEHWYRGEADSSTSKIQFNRRNARAWYKLFNSKFKNGFYNFYII